MREADLYQPIKALWESKGFCVKGEINQCDLVAEKENLFLICELKCSLNLEVILQGTNRQRICDYVYVCVPQKKATRSRQKQRQLYDLLRRLNLGLIQVHFGENGACARIAIEAKPALLMKNARKKSCTIQEFSQRISENIGGVNHTKIVTCYRENAIMLAALLRENHGPMRAADCVKLGADKKASTIMRQNVYGWFLHVDRGVYDLTPRGREALTEYEDLIRILIKRGKEHEEIIDD